MTVIDIAEIGVHIAGTNAYAPDAIIAAASEDSFQHAASVADSLGMSTSNMRRTMETSSDRLEVTTQ